MWSRPWLTRTTSEPAFITSWSFTMPFCLRRGFSTYSKYSSPNRSRRSRLTPRKTMCNTRVAKTRFVQYRSGRASASAPIAPRRLQRSRKDCAFQLKKPTGLTAVRSSKLPSTRQKTRLRTSAGEIPCALGLFPFALPETDEDICRKDSNLRIRNGNYHALRRQSSQHTHG